MHFRKICKCAGYRAVADAHSWNSGIDNAVEEINALIDEIKAPLHPGSMGHWAVGVLLKPLKQRLLKQKIAASLEKPTINIAGNVRIIISTRDAIYYYNTVSTKGHTLETAKQLYDSLWCGRISFAIKENQLKPLHKMVLLQKGCISLERHHEVVFVCDKEVFPPVFRIGDF